MMRHWLICFSIGTGVLLCADTATVSGVVEVTSAPHSAREHGRHLSDIVVWLEPADGALTPGTSLPRAQMLQKDKMFHPHVLPIQVGTAVEFPNADPIFHNAFSNYDGQLFDVALYPPGASRTVMFRKAGVARVFCNIHPSMSAIILVLKTSLFARVEPDGRYRIPNVPAGRYQVYFYDEWAANGNRPVVELTVGGNAVEVSVPELRISETSYATLPPHKNKYGQDYPSGANTYGSEPGPPK